MILLVPSTRARSSWNMLKSAYRHVHFYLYSNAFSRLAQHNNIPTSLFPSDPYANAIVRLQADHINRTLIPAFYRYLQAQDAAAQIEGGKDFLSAIEQLVSLFERAEEECGEAPEANAVGLWQETGALSWSDVMAAPCMPCLPPDFSLPTLVSVNIE